MALLHFLGTRYRSTKNDGTVNASGTLEFFEPGTSTAKITYSDSALTSANEAIITLDSAGAADVWFTGDADVTIRLFGSALGVADGTIIDTFSSINTSASGGDNSGNFNYILNPSFESTVDADGKPASWDLFTYTGSTPVKDTTDPDHGDAAFKFTTANPSNGGGYLTSTEAFYVSPNNSYDVSWLLKSSAVTMTNKVQVLWIDKADADVSTTTLYTEGAASPTSWARFLSKATPPATAVKAKLRLVFADPATSTVGSTQFDDISFSPRESTNYITATGTDTFVATLDPALVEYNTADKYYIKFTNANATTTPTLNINGLGAKTLKKEGSSALVAGDVAAGATSIIIYDGTDMLILNPSTTSVTPLTVRQAVLTAANDTTTGVPDWITTGSGLACNTTASTSEPLALAFAKGFSTDGNIDTVQSITADGTGTWASLTDEAVCFLYAQDDGGSVSYSHVANRAPVYGPSFAKAAGARRSLMHFEGSGQTFVDENPLITWTVAGQATQSSGDKKFGTQALQCDGTGDYIKSNITIYNQPFVMEWWMKPDDLVSARYFFSTETAANYGFNIRILATSGKLSCYLSTNGSSYNVWSDEQTTNGVSASAWHHVRIQWDGATYKLYLDGTEEISTASTAPPLTAASQGGIISLGDSYGLGSRYLGYIDEFYYEENPQTVGTYTNPTAAYVALQRDGEHWFDTNEMKMNSWNESGTSWDAKDRLFCGEAVTASSAVSSVTPYAFGDSWVQNLIGTGADVTVSHNTGVTPAEYTLHKRGGGTTDAYVDRKDITVLTSTNGAEYTLKISRGW